MTHWNSTRSTLFATSAFVYGCVCIAGSAYAGTEDPTPGISVQRIWDQAPHNAFTDLTRWKGQFYCTFREANRHVSGGNGKIRVIASPDGAEWRSIALIEKDGIDLRDPKLSVTPDGRLMLLIGGSYYNGRQILKRLPWVAFMDETSFSDPVPIAVDERVKSDFDWLWRVTWHGGTGYGVIYQTGAEKKEPWNLHLVKTTDGISYDLVSTMEITGTPNESTVRFLEDGEMMIVVRNEIGHGHLGRSRAPFTQWTWHKIEDRLGGPNFLELPDGTIVLGTREYGEKTKTVLGTLSREGKFVRKVILPSGGDTSYPGMVLHDGELWVSYYSSHEKPGKPTSIYLARVVLDKFDQRPEKGEDEPCSNEP